MGRRQSRTAVTHRGLSWHLQHITCEQHARHCSTLQLVAVRTLPATHTSHTRRRVATATGRRGVAAATTWGSAPQANAAWCGTCQHIAGQHFATPQTIPARHSIEQNAAPGHNASQLTAAHASISHFRQLLAYSSVRHRTKLPQVIAYRRTWQHAAVGGITPQYIPQRAATCDGATMDGDFRDMRLFVGSPNNIAQGH